MHKFYIGISMSYRYDKKNSRGQTKHILISSKEQNKSFIL